jgi:coenzyme F420-reducing hydrogenase gamma subunit
MPTTVAHSYNHEESTIETPWKTIVSVGQGATHGCVQNITNGDRWYWVKKDD